MTIIRPQVLPSAIAMVMDERPKTVFIEVIGFFPCDEL